MIESLQGYARNGLEAELARLDAERERVQVLLASLDGPRSSAVIQTPAEVKRTRQMSEAGRQAIREAVRRRCARVRAAGAGEAQGADTIPSASTPAAPKRRSQQAPKTGNGKK